MTSMVRRWPPVTGRIESVDWQSTGDWKPEGGNRQFWIGRTGFGFWGSYRGYNVHWETMRRPWRRWSRGDYHWVDFFKQILRGVKVFLLG